MSSSYEIKESIAHIPWDPTAFAGFSAEQMELVRKGFNFALDRVYEAERAAIVNCGGARRKLVPPTGPRHGLSDAAPRLLAALKGIQSAIAEDSQHNLAADYAAELNEIDAAIADAEGRA